MGSRETPIAETGLAAPWSATADLTLAQGAGPHGVEEGPGSRAAGGRPRPDRGATRGLRPVGATRVHRTARIVVALAGTWVGLLGLATVTWASGPHPYPGAFSSSRDGRWYTIVTRDGRFALVARREGREARQASVGVPAGNPDAWPVILPDDGDRVVATGACGRPEDVQTLAQGQGFVVSEEWAAMSRLRVLGRYDGSGREVWSRTLAELFEPAVRTRFVASMARLHWRETWWVSSDETRVIVVAAGGSARVLSVATGDPMDLAEDLLLDRLHAGDWENVGRVIDAATRAGSPWIAARARGELARGPEQDVLALRWIRALVELRRAADAERARFRSILRTTREPRALEEGLRSVVVVDPPFAAELVSTALAKGDPRLVEAISSASDAVWDEIGPRLRALITNTASTPGARRVAIQVVGRLASRRHELVPLLEAATRDATPGVAREAVGALAFVEGAEARTALRAVLSRGGEGEPEALAFLLSHPTVEDVPALIAALRRRPVSVPDHERVLHGLRVAAGTDVGADPDAWEGWVRSQRR